MALSPIASSLVPPCFSSVPGAQPVDTFLVCGLRPNSRPSELSLFLPLLFIFTLASSAARKQVVLAELKMQRPSVIREHHGPLSAVSASKKEQGTRLKRHLDRGLIRNMSAAPKFYKNGKQVAVEAENRNGKEFTVHRSEARPHKRLQEGKFQGTLMRSQPREHSVLSYTPVTLEQQPVISFSREPRGPSARPQRFSSVILQPRATPGPLLLQPQVPDATKQDTVAAALEWQRKLEAAEALLALKNSSQVPPDSASLQQRASMPGPAGDRGLQPPSPYLPPRPASSVALTGHLECMSFLT
ncbi:doublesex- and mab-3-related transcription factor C1-like isoform X2 [Peromyscus maniculatus bairdii]|uniref:doublesex- and mab-3-related transcription factor C1-like isoform X2 n=1 Tax=Peromyscus maniculatus bairdii TaxID=230844 RepID=UPI001C2EA67B|nr:doublesex- and mab-3-related transcription factor C1-like isoform X2 [Peromyscus maniculatus bairdii]